MFRSTVIVWTMTIFAPLATAGGKAAVLRVASPELPQRFSPIGPLTDADRQALDLIFEPLVAAWRDDNGAIHYRPRLAEAIPFGQGAHVTFRIRPGAKWSDGELVSAGDVRASLEHVRRDAGAAFAWHALLETPQQGKTPHEVRFSLHYGLIDPWECFTFPILPQRHAGRELHLGDNADFGEKPVGSGPFAFVGPIKQANMHGVAFRKNPHHPSAAAVPFDEIHWFAATRKELEALKADLILGFDAHVPNAEAALTRRVWYVAPNHRHPLLGKSEWRRFLSAAIERDKIIDAQPKLSVNGLTPRDSWTRTQASRVANDLHNPEVARALASDFTKVHKSVALSFKFPIDQTSPMTQLAEQWRSAAKAAGIDLTIQLMPLSSRDLAQALAKQDFELALACEDHGDSIGRLLALFDPRAQALEVGGSNFLGVGDGAGALLEQVAALPRTRQFSLLREQMHNLHAQLVQSMPLIPLWQHQAHYALNGAYRVTRFDPLRPFADLSAWQK